MNFPIFPVFQNAITLVCCGDENFVALTGVLWHSVIGQAAPDRCYDLIYLHNGISTESREGLLSLARGRENVSVRIFDLEAHFSEEGLYCANRSGFSPMAYARLLIPELLSRDYSRALYLDGDMIALRDIAPLFDADLEGKPLGAIRDFGMCGMVAAGDAEGKHWQEYLREHLGFSKAEAYINSGLLLMDLEAWRRDGLCEKLLETALSRNWEAHDQDVINRCFHGRIRYLDPCWGVYDILNLVDFLPPALQRQYREALSGARLVHFASSNPKSCFTFRGAWSVQFWNLAAQTPFYSRLLGQLRFAAVSTGLTGQLARLAHTETGGIGPGGTRDWTNDPHRAMLLFFLLHGGDPAGEAGGAAGVAFSRPQEEGLYARLYGTGTPSRMKAFISRLLPAPRKNIRRDMELLEEMLIQQKNALSELVYALGGDVSGGEGGLSTLPESGGAETPYLTLGSFRKDLRQVYATLDRNSRLLRQMQQLLEKKHKNV